MRIRDFDAIIFDLGGVILNLDYNLTVQAFKDLGLESFDTMYSKANQSGLFDDFEIGKISQQVFINSVLDYLPANTSANKVVEAWNSMLLNFPVENIQFLQNIKSEIPTYLLSNTNEIHVQSFHRKLQTTTNLSTLHPLFQEVYFSNEIGRRKPHVETFDFVCKSNVLTPEKTLFIDDSLQHIEGAKKLGLQTYHFQTTDNLSTLFTN